MIISSTLQSFLHSRFDSWKGIGKSTHISQVVLVSKDCEVLGTSHASKTGKGIGLLEWEMEVWDAVDNKHLYIREIKRE